jgi:thioesterase domain-containing protein
VLPFYRLAHRLGPEQPCYGLEIALRRRGLRIELEIGDIADAFLEGMRRVGPRGPWRLGGWSFGGFVAWEMAARLRSGGEEVSHVVLVDTDSSLLGRPITFESAVRGAGRLAQMIWYAKPFVRDTLHVRLAVSLRGGRKTGPLRQALMNLLWKAGIERAEIAEHIERDPRLLEVRSTAWGIIGNLRHYLRAKRRYRPPAQQEDLDLIRAGRIDRGTPRRVKTRRTLGWERYATGPLHLHRLAGNHFTILDRPHVGELAETLNRILARA